MALSGNLFQQKQVIEAKIKTLINNDLKEVCRKENLQVSGVKAQLQRRILEFLETAVVRGDTATLDRLKYRVNTHGRSPPPEGMGGGSFHLASTTNNSASGAYGTSHLQHNYQMPSKPFGSAARLQFKKSPFYTVIEPLAPGGELPEMPNNRHTVTINTALSEPVCDQLRADPSLRVMLYCALGPASAYMQINMDVAFPAQIEVRLNGDEVKSNYRGLKNKAGTTKPADLTDQMRKNQGYNNILSITYALTTRKYVYTLNLVRNHSAEKLTNQIKSGKVITKEQVLQEMAKKASDPDIVATQTIMSLKDPVSTLRITVPCRSIICSHNQCFDASYFLQLQEQAPTWTCPVCSKTISYDALAIDEYVQLILDGTSKSTEQVTIEPAGDWHEVQQGDGQDNHAQKRAPYDFDSDDDLVEIPDSRVGKVKAEAKSATPALLQQTPPLSSREASTPTAMARLGNTTNGAKRSSTVIDLTLSDDDEPPRPAKRHNTSQSNSYNTPASLPDTRNTDMRPRQQAQFGQGQLQQSRSDNTLAPFQPRSSSSVTNGQRLPWTFGPPSAPTPPTTNYNAWRDTTGSYSASP